MKARTDTSDWIALCRQIERRSTISRSEIADLLTRHLGVGTDYAIRRLRQEGVIEPVKLPRRGLYIVASNETHPERILQNPIVAIQIQYGEDILFCYGSALYLHGLSRYGRLLDYYVAAEETKKQSTIGQIRVHFVKTSLDATVGTTTIEALDKRVKVTDAERTLIDCIHRPKYAQGWENIVHAIDRIGKLNQDRLSGYLKQYRLPSLVAKTCAILDRFSDNLGMDVEQLVRLRSYLPKKPIRFSRDEPGVLNKRWNVYVPRYLIKE